MHTEFSSLCLVPELKLCAAGKCCDRQALQCTHLQAFNWVSHKGDYYGHICDMASKFAELGFTYVWLPPPTASVSPEGYMPTDYFNLSSCYGDEAGLRRAVAALKANGLKVAGDCVLNHRCALMQDEHGIWNKVRHNCAIERAFSACNKHISCRTCRTTSSSYYWCCKFIV